MHETDVQACRRPMACLNTKTLCFQKLQAEVAEGNIQPKQVQNILDFESRCPPLNVALHFTNETVLSGLVET
jgi:hypothetical protein